VKTNGAAATPSLRRSNRSRHAYAIMANSASNLLGIFQRAIDRHACERRAAHQPEFFGNGHRRHFSGSGANLTSLNANNLASGTVPLGQLSGITGGQLAAATWQLART